MSWKSDSSWRNIICIFEGGQIQIEKKIKDPMPWDVKIEAQRGHISKINLTEASVNLHLSWLCDLRYYFDGSDLRRPRWFLRPLLVGKHFRIDLSPYRYYTQPDEERLKLRTMKGEVCHFYLPSDHTNLIDNGTQGELVPYCISNSSRKIWFKQLMVQLYVTGKWKIPDGKYNVFTDR